MGLMLLCRLQAQLLQTIRGLSQLSSIPPPQYTVY